MFLILNKSLLVKDLLLLSKIKKPMKIIVVDIIYKLCIKVMIFGVIFNFSQANNSLNISSCKISENFGYIDVDKIEKKCKQFIPKTYVYICKTYPGGKRLIFIKDNHVIQSIPSREEDLFDKTPIMHIKDIEDHNTTKEAVTRKIRGSYWVKSMDICLLSERFNFLRNFRHETVNAKEVIEVNEKYGYLSVIGLTRNKDNFEGTRLYKFTHKSIYSYGLLLLPNDIQYTKKVTEKILNKYKQAWKCVDKKLHSKAKKNDTNLTLLEKAVGREKLECLDKYLMWNENE